MTPELRLQKLEAIVTAFVKSGMFQITKDMQISNGRNIILNTDTGTKFATDPTQKLSFYGVTPVRQYVFSFSDEANPTTYDNTTANIITGMERALKAYGLITS